MRRGLLVAVTAAAFLLPACAARPPQASGAPAAIPRRSVVWLGPEGVDLATAGALAARGVDLLVVHRGSVSLAGGVPVLRLAPSPPVSGPVPAATAIRLEGLDGDLDPSLADVLWQGLSADFGSDVPAELIFELRRTPPGLADLLARLAFVSGVPVVPVLLPEQLDQEEVGDVIVAARGAIVPAFGILGAFRPGSAEGARPLRERVEAIAGLGVPVRIAIVLAPSSEPQLDGWSEGVVEPIRQGAAEWSADPGWQCTLTFRKPLTWNGRTWRAGETVRFGWTDAARLDTVLREVGRLHLPEVAGWDLLWLPPEERAIGLSRAGVLAYLAGEGPEPEVTVTAERRGGEVTARMVNSGPFSSALSGYGNWVEVGVEGATLVGDDRGDFDRIALGVRDRSGEWRRATSGGVTAVRFGTALVAPGIDLVTGPVRLTRRDARVTVRWQVVLSTGEEIGGTVAVPR